VCVRFGSHWQIFCPPFLVYFLIAFLVKESRVMLATGAEPWTSPFKHISNLLWNSFLSVK
jgi:hypothetical protein